jgi:DNA primase
MYDKNKIYDKLIQQCYYTKLFNVPSSTAQNISTNCPFLHHQDNAPSFSISTTKPIYKCFGCGEEGDWLTFLQNYNSWDFKQALEYLASEAGVSKTPYIGQKAKQVDYSSANKENRAITSEQIGNNVNYWCKCVESLDANPKLRERFEKIRGISPETQKIMGLGIDLKKKEWIIPCISIEHMNELGYPLCVGFERRMNTLVDNFTDTNCKCKKSFGTPSTMCAVSEYSHTMSEVIILEGFLDSFCYYDYLVSRGEQHKVWILTSSCGLGGLVEQIQRLDFSNFKSVSFMLDNDKAGLDKMQELEKLFPDYNYIKLGEPYGDFSDFWLANRGA